MPVAAAAGSPPAGGVARSATTVPDAILRPEVEAVWTVMRVAVTVVLAARPILAVRVEEPPAFRTNGAGRHAPVPAIPGAPIGPGPGGPARTRPAILARPE